MSNLNYGVVGNCRTAALISEKGSIDWLCFPDFDSPSIFASLLDRERGGSFGFDVTEDYHISQSYVPHTNILSTSFSSKEGEFVVLDYMPYYRSCENAHYLPAELYRYVRWIKGKPRFKVNYVPAPNYAQGKVIHNVTSEFIESYCSSDNKDRQYLYSSLPLQDIEQKKEIILEKDEFFLLSYNEKVIPVDIEREKIEYCRTLVYWLNWTNRTKKYSLYNDVIERSMLVLKLMSYYNGAVLAALTTSLPESVGEVRNWDYRFCWLRDASMSIETLFQIGHIGAARRFMKFIQSTFVSKHESYQIMYGIRGERQLTEIILEHLSGYKNSKPVRIGNDAYHQKQNDSFGYLMDLIYQYYRLMPGTLDEIEDMWEMVKSILSTIVGITAATSTAALYGCGSKEGSSEGSKALGPIPTDKMTYRSFPGLGSDKVSILGYGCMRWPTVPAPDGKGEMIDQDAVNELVDYAIAHGVNYFDTSPMYVQGWSEKSTGIALKRHPRESFYLATKLSNFHPDTWTREGSIAMYRKSFEDIQVDYIDYYLLHMIGGGGMEQFRKRYIDNGMIDFLVKEREAGRIRRLGWSFHGDIEVYDYALQMHDRGEVHWDFVQIQLNYVDWKHASGSNFKAEYLYDELAKRKIPAVIMEPLLGGRLSNVPDHIVARLKQREPERSVASWAFRYAGSPQDVLTVLSGMTYMEHLQDNIRTYSPLVPLTEEETQYLYDTADLMMEYPTIPCNDCKYCMPCPYGIDIPAILIHYNKCVNEGNVPESSQDENYRKARRAFLVGYDRSVPKLRQADHCTGCNQCSPHCPQTIDIPKELHRIDKFVEQLKQETL